MVEMFMCMPMLSRDMCMGVFLPGIMCVIGPFCTRIHTRWKAVDKWHSCHGSAILVLRHGRRGSLTIQDRTGAGPKKKGRLDTSGIEPDTSRMLSERDKPTTPCAHVFLKAFHVHDR